MNKRIFEEILNGEPQQDTTSETSVDVSVSVTDSVSAVEETNETVDEIVEEATVVEEVEEASATLENYKSSISENGISKGTMALIMSTKVLPLLAQKANKVLPAIESLDTIGENPVEAEEIVSTIEVTESEVLEPMVEESLDNFVELCAKLKGQLHKSTRVQATMIKKVMEEVATAPTTETEETFTDQAPKPLDGMTSSEIVEAEVTIENVPDVEQPEEITVDVIEEVMSNMAEPQENKTVADTDMVDPESAVEYLRKCLALVEKSSRSTMKCISRVTSMAEKAKTLSGVEKIQAVSNIMSYGSKVINRNRKINRQAFKSVNNVARILVESSVIDVEDAVVTYTPGCGRDE